MDLENTSQYQEQRNGLEHALDQLPENEKILLVFRPFLSLDRKYYRSLQKMKKRKNLERILGYSLGSLGYGVLGSIWNFPNGNALPAIYQKQSLMLQGRNILTYSLWGLCTDIVLQGAKLYAAYEAASVEHPLGSAAAGVIGLWTAYKIIEIPARICLIATRKEPMPFIIIEGVYQGYLSARRGIEKLNPFKKMKDTLTVVRRFYKNIAK